MGSSSDYGKQAAANIREVADKAAPKPAKGSAWSSKPGKGPGSKSGKK